MAKKKKKPNALHAPDAPDSPSVADVADAEDIVVPQEDEDDNSAMGFGAAAPASTGDVIEEDQEDDKEEKSAAEPSSPPAEPPAAPPAAPPAPPPAAPIHVTAHAPADTPAPAIDVVVIDVEPSPGAAKFINTVSKAGSTLATLGASEVSDGMLELSRQSTMHMKDSFSTFKTHSLDLAVTATSDAPNGQKSWKLAASQAEWRKLADLPLAALYAVIALACLCAFAVIYYPKQYGPLLLDKAKTKFIEW